MFQEYPIYHNETAAGTALVEKQGLYYKISCRCKIREDRCRIRLTAGEAVFDLGLCVPTAEGMALQTRIPIKQTEQSQLRFQLWNKNADERFIAVSPDQPFAYLSNLASARFAKEGSAVGLIIKSLSQAPQDSGQNP